MLKTSTIKKGHLFGKTNFDAVRNSFEISKKRNGFYLSFRRYFPNSFPKRKEKLFFNIRFIQPLFINHIFHSQSIDKPFIKLLKTPCTESISRKNKFSGESFSAELTSHYHHHLFFK